MTTKIWEVDDNQIPSIPSKLKCLCITGAVIYSNGFKGKDITIHWLEDAEGSELIAFHVTTQNEYGRFGFDWIMDKNRRQRIKDKIRDGYMFSCEIQCQVNDVYDHFFSPDEEELYNDPSLPDKFQEFRLKVQA